MDGEGHQPKAKVNWGSQVASEREQELFFIYKYFICLQF